MRKLFQKLIFWTVVILLLSLLAMPVMAAAPGQDQPPPGVQVPEAVLLLISGGAGWLATKVITWLKTSLDWTQPTDKIKNVWLSLGVSTILAVLLLLITNSFVPITGPQTVITWLGIIFTTATVIYQSSHKPTPEVLGP